MFMRSSARSIQAYSGIFLTTSKFIFLCAVMYRMEDAERKELRERHRREREKMNLPRHQEPEPGNLFSAPIRVSTHLFGTILFVEMFCSFTKLIKIIDYTNYSHLFTESESRPKNCINFG